MIISKLWHRWTVVAWKALPCCTCLGGKKTFHGSVLAKVRNRIISVSLTKVLNRSCIKSSSMLYLSWGLQVGMYHASATKWREQNHRFLWHSLKWLPWKWVFVALVWGNRWLHGYMSVLTRWEIQPFFYVRYRRIKSNQVKSTSSVFHKWKICVPNQSKFKRWSPNQEVHKRQARV